MSARVQDPASGKFVAGPPLDPTAPAPICEKHACPKKLLSNGHGGKLWRCRACLRAGEARYRERYRATRGAP